MAQSPGEVHQALEGMLEVLDAEAGLDGDGSEQRQEWRRPLDVECEVCTFHGPEHTAETAQGKTRNVTFCGVAISADLPGPVPRNRPVEIMIEYPGGKKTHLAGIVAFCRGTDAGQYELGVDVRASSANRVLTYDVEETQRIYDWFAEALNVPE